MTSTVFAGLAICIGVATLTVLKGRVLEHSSAHSVHAFLILLANSRSIRTRYLIEESYSESFIETGIAWTGVIFELFVSRVKATDILITNFHLSAQSFQLFIASLLESFESNRQTDQLFGLMSNRNALSIFTSESRCAFDVGACDIFFDTSSMEALESLTAFDSETLSDAGWDV